VASVRGCVARSGQEHHAPDQIGAAPGEVALTIVPRNARPGQAFGAVVSEDEANGLFKLTAGVGGTTEGMFGPGRVGVGKLTEAVEIQPQTSNRRRRVRRARTASKRWAMTGRRRRCRRDVQHDATDGVPSGGGRWRRNRCRPAWGWDAGVGFTWSILGRLSWGGFLYWA